MMPENKDEFSLDCVGKAMQDGSTQKDYESEGDNVDGIDDDESESDDNDEDFVITAACRRSCFIAWTRFRICCHGSGFSGYCDTECRRRVAAMKGCRHVVLLCQLCSQPRLECACDGEILEME